MPGVWKHHHHMRQKSTHDAAKHFASRIKNDTLYVYTVINYSNCGPKGFTALRQFLTKDISNNYFTY